MMVMLQFRERRPPANVTTRGAKGRALWRRLAAMLAFIVARLIVPQIDRPAGRGVKPPA
jgi:hypothetical protein